MFLCLGVPVSLHLGVRVFWCPESQCFGVPVFSGSWRLSSDFCLGVSLSRYFCVAARAMTTCRIQRHRFPIASVWAQPGSDWYFGSVGSGPEMAGWQGVSRCVLYFVSPLIFPVGVGCVCMCRCQFCVGSLKCFESWSHSPKYICRICFAGGFAQVSWALFCGGPSRLGLLECSCRMVPRSGFTVLYLGLSWYLLSVSSLVVSMSGVRVWGFGVLASC